MAETNQSINKLLYSTKAPFSGRSSIEVNHPYVTNTTYSDKTSTVNPPGA